MRCLRDDLELALPALDQRLEDLAHPVVEKAQAIPESIEASGAERIESIDDRIWFKVKTGIWRGAVTQIQSPSGGPYAGEQLSWLGAAGHRRADSAQHDFYATFERKCIAFRKQLGASAGANTNSAPFLPDDRDYRRLSAERAFAGHHLARAMVRRLAATSLRSSHPAEATFDGWQLTVSIRSDGQRGGLAYIVLAGSGLTDPKVFAVMLSAIPGIEADDWMLEPSHVLGLKPASGAMVYSAYISPEAQALLLGSIA